MFSIRCDLMHRTSYFLHFCRVFLQSSAITKHEAYPLLFYFPLFPPLLPCPSAASSFIFSCFSTSIEWFATCFHDLDFVHRPNREAWRGPVWRFFGTGTRVIVLSLVEDRRFPGNHDSDIVCTTATKFRKVLYEVQLCGMWALLQVYRTKRTKTLAMCLDSKIR